MLRTASPHWHPPVIVASAAAATGIDAFWTEIERYRNVMTESGEFHGGGGARL